MSKWSVAVEPRRVVDNLDEDEVLALLELGIIDLTCRVRQLSRDEGWVILGDAFKVILVSRQASPQACEQMQARFKDLLDRRTPPPPPASPSASVPPPPYPAPLTPLAPEPIAYADLPPNFQDADTDPPFPIPVRASSSTPPSEPPPPAPPPPAPPAVTTPPGSASPFTPASPAPGRKTKIWTIAGIAAAMVLLFAAWRIFGARASEKLESRLAAIRALPQPEAKIGALLRLRAESGHFEPQVLTELKATATIWAAQQPLPALPLTPVDDSLVSELLAQPDPVATALTYELARLASNEPARSRAINSARQLVAQSAPAPAPERDAGKSIDPEVQEILEKFPHSEVFTAAVADRVVTRLQQSQDDYLSKAQAILSAFKRFPEKRGALQSLLKPPETTGSAVLAKSIVQKLGDDTGLFIQLLSPPSDTNIHELLWRVAELAHLPPLAQELKVSLVTRLVESAKSAELIPGFQEAERLGKADPDDSTAPSSPHALASALVVARVLEQHHPKVDVVYDFGRRIRRAAELSLTEKKIGPLPAYYTALASADRDTQIQWYREAANLGHAESMLAIGRKFTDRIAANPNSKAAAELKEGWEFLKKASAAGLPEANYWMGRGKFLSWSDAAQRASPNYERMPKQADEDADESVGLLCAVLRNYGSSAASPTRDVPPELQYDATNMLARLYVFYSNIGALNRVARLQGAPLADWLAVGAKWGDANHNADYLFDHAMYWAETGRYVDALRYLKRGVELGQRASLFLQMIETVIKRGQEDPTTAADPEFIRYRAWYSAPTLPGTNPKKGSGRSGE